MTLDVLLSVVIGLFVVVGSVGAAILAMKIAHWADENWEDK